LKSTTQKVNFLKKIFGSGKLSREGSNIAFKCPVCGEKKGKFSINLNTWMCHCWICGAKSKNVYFIIKKYIGSDCSNKFIKEFDVSLNLKIDENEDMDLEASLPENFKLLANFKGRDPDIKKCISYCFSRGLTKRDLWYFKIGYSTDRSMKKRVIIPSFNRDGELNYFVSRGVDETVFPKYSNSTARKIEIIFNEINIDFSKEVTIVEGPFDLVKCNKNATCLLGSKLSKKSALFKKIIENKTPVLLALDPDMRLESHRIAKLLSSFGCKVRILNNKTLKDVGDMSKSQFLRIRESSKHWSRDDSLMFKISSLKSGSIF
tara:strand:- start:10596 stop:11552 length:957 start_codon:yes stop_codon:yes gene_type:complete